MKTIYVKEVRSAPDANGGTRALGSFRALYDRGLRVLVFRYVLFKQKGTYEPLLSGAAEIEDRIVSGAGDDKDSAVRKAVLEGEKYEAQLLAGEKPTLAGRGASP